jgi:hypothetical protein
MKLRQSICMLIALAMIAALIACGSSSKSTPPPPAVLIAATSGTPQSAVVGAAFAAPLVATVTTGGSPTSGVTVTFTAPTSGASGSFAGGVNTATTNASGVATSPAFTANATAGAYTVTASVSGASSPASFSLTNTAAPVESIAATSGTPQNAAISTAFASPLVATVTKGGTPMSGVAVTFTAPASGATGTFTNGTASETDTTNASGVATSTTFTANSTLGQYAVTAAAAGVSTPVDFNLTNVVATTLADGTYVFTLNGEDQFTFSGAACPTSATTANNIICGPYFVAGAFVVSAGTITSGEQDFIDLGIFAEDAITGGTVTTSTDADGNLQIVLNTADTSIGVSGVETLNGTLVTTSTGVITEFDASATASGFLAQQTSGVAAPSGGYAFVTTGLDGNPTTPAPVAIGGVINVDGTASGGVIPISGTGSVFDINDDGTVAQAQSFAASNVTTPDSFGRVVFTLNPSVASGVAQINLVGYIVGPQNIWLVETIIGSDFNGTTGGEALGQGTNTGTFTSTSFTSYEFGTTGADTNGTLQVAGVVNAASGTAVGGTINYNDLTGTGTQAPSSLTGGTYTVDSTGRVTLTGVTDGTVTFNLQLYLNGNGKATAISMDSGDVLAGLANQQTGGGSFTASSFSGLYAANASGFDFNNELEFDAAGLISADGVSALGGTVDLNFMTPPGTQTPGVSVSGAFSANASGVFTGTITGFDIDNPTNNDAFTFYMVDTTRTLAIETDPNQLTTIKFALQH